MSPFPGSARNADPMIDKMNPRTKQITKPLILVLQLRVDWSINCRRSLVSIDTSLAHLGSKALFFTRRRCNVGSRVSRSRTKHPTELVHDGGQFDSFESFWIEATREETKAYDSDDNTVNQIHRQNQQFFWFLYLRAIFCSIVFKWKRRSWSTASLFHDHIVHFGLLGRTWEWLRVFKHDERSCS